MEILTRGNAKALLDYLPQIKTSLKDWMFVNIRLTSATDADFTIDHATQMIHDLFRDREGKIYVSKDFEALMLVKWGQDNPPSIIADSIAKTLPDGSCEVHTQQPSAEGLAKLEILITGKKPAQLLSALRKARKENVFLVADDDMFQRILIKKGLFGLGTVVEVASGDEAVSAFRQHNPDILFLDIHMPGRSGKDVVAQIMESDPDAFIIMVSADASQENVSDTWQKGAKYFLSKPFTGGRLLDCVKKCPTFVGTV